MYKLQGKLTIQETYEKFAHRLVNIPLAVYRTEKYADLPMTISEEFYDTLSQQQQNNFMHISAFHAAESICETLLVDVEVYYKKISFPLPEFLNDEFKLALEHQEKCKLIDGYLSVQEASRFDFHFRPKKVNEIMEFCCYEGKFR